MNMHAPSVLAPPAARSIEDTGLSLVMMRDILLKTMFRMNLDQVTELARVMCLPVNVTQELMDRARNQKLVEATGTLHANSGGEMGYQLSDAGKARALDALSQSEYYGAMPIPMAEYAEAGQTPVDPQHSGDAAAAAGRDGPSDSAERTCSITSALRSAPDARS